MCKGVLGLAPLSGVLRKNEYCYRKYKVCARQNLQAIASCYGVVINQLLPPLVVVADFQDVLYTLIQNNYGVDVSSGEELCQAIEMGSSNIVFSGPGKTDIELGMALQHSKKVILLVDSFGELLRLQKIATQNQQTMRIGVRVQPPNGWANFGIPLEMLKDFYAHLHECPNLKLCGVHFHNSWNFDSKAQILTIRALARQLKIMPPEMYEQIDFIDIGGGYWPEEGEWSQPKIVGGKYTWHPASPIKVFAKEIADTIKNELFSLLGECSIHVSPGRWLVHDCMHCIMSVVDIKNNNLAITDAGTNCIGWERFEEDYFPILNLSNPAMEEKAFRIHGSLCTPRDMWGHGFWGSDLHIGDVLLIPNQGAYTYSLQQKFIKPLPQVLSML